MGALKRRALACITGGAAALLAALPAAAQNGYSFEDAQQSAVDYVRPVMEAARDCEAFEAYTSYDFSIISAERVPEQGDVPAHCRLIGVIVPEVGFRVSLPAQWNGRFYMSGNGGFAGQAVDDPAGAGASNAALARNFATAYTDTGHDARREPLASFAEDRQKLVDYAYRAVHLTALTAKSLIADYYGREASWSYFDGCSTGGRQALMSAQRFPQDFDGIVAGAPVLNLVGTGIADVWSGRALREGGVTMDKVELLADAVYARCDAADGLEDGLISDPRQCDFEPARDLPRCEAGAEGAGCFSEEQIAGLEKFYGGVVSEGEEFFPGWPVGAERGGWIPWRMAPQGPGLAYNMGESQLRYLAFPQSDADYSADDFDFGRDIPRTAAARQLLNADDPDLSAFARAGGKLLSYFGWADPALNPLMGVNYYEAVMAELGAADTRDFYRLYMAPGMFHCRGGIGPDRFDAMTPLIEWVEAGRTPQVLIAEQQAEGETLRSRPLCPYPEAAAYDGSGSPDAAENFSCRAE